MENRSQRTAEEIFPVLRNLTERYTSKVSTSVTVERAESLLGAIFYCMNEAVNQWEEDGVSSELPDSELPDSLCRPLKELDAAALYDRGYELVYKKVLEAKRIYEELLPVFETYGSLALRDTVLSGMPEFFLRYDARFTPQEHLLMLDYPLLIRLEDSLEGIDRIFEYLLRTRMEQRFLAMFPKSYVIQVLNQYHPSYGELIFNLCSVLLNNILGHMLMEKPLGDQGYTAGELEQITAKIRGLQKKELEGLLRVNLRGMIGGNAGGDQELYHYLSEYLPEAAEEMQCAAKLGRPDRVFLL